MNRFVGRRRRLGHYEYNRDENPLSDRERILRSVQRKKMFKRYAEDQRKKQQDHIELDPSRLGDQFSAVFAQLMGPESVNVTNSTPEELQAYSKKLSADIKWIEAVLKELNREREFIDELCRWQGKQLESGEDSVSDQKADGRE